MEFYSFLILSLTRMSSCKHGQSCKLRSIRIRVWSLFISGCHSAQLRYFIFSPCWTGSEQVSSNLSWYCLQDRFPWKMVLLLHLVFKALLRVMLTVLLSCFGCSVFGLLSKRFSVAIVTWSLLIRKKSAVIPRAKVPVF